VSNRWFVLPVTLVAVLCLMGAQLGWFSPSAQPPVGAEAAQWKVLVRYGSNVQPGVDLLLQIPTGQHYWTSGTTWHYVSSLVGIKIRESEADWLIESIGWDCETRKVTVYVKPIGELARPTCPPPLPVETCAPCNTPTRTATIPVTPLATATPSKTLVATPTPFAKIPPFIGYTVKEGLNDSYDRGDSIGDWADVFDDPIMISAGNSMLGAQLTPIIDLTIRYQDGSKTELRACRFACGDVLEMDNGQIWILQGYTGGTKVYPKEY